MALLDEVNFIPTRWKTIILEYIQARPEHWEQLEAMYLKETTQYEGMLQIFPPKESIFRCFHFFEPEETKVVLIGQDPYHGMNQATGLCFGIPTEQSIPPSLRNIMKELKEDLQISLPETSVTLDHWANQGVLMLNTALTVRQGTASSHMKYWLPFTKYIFKYLSNNCPNLVYLVWGAFAHRQVEEIVDWTQNKAVISSHPSPLSAYKPYKTFPPFLGSKPFSKVNSLLEKKQRIKWA